MKLSNDVEKYEIEVTKMGQNYSFFFLTVYPLLYNHGIIHVACPFVTSNDDLYRLQNYFCLVCDVMCIFTH